jgi:hypothetical protein
LEVAGMDKTARQELISIMVQRLGRRELAVSLGAPLQRVDAWIAGRAVIPDRYLVELVLLVESPPG